MFDHIAYPARRAFLLSSAALSATFAFGCAHSNPGQPSNNDEIFSWVTDIYEIGRAGRYGYRMPGTEADHRAARYIADKLRSFGCTDVVLEPVPLALALPEEWRLVAHAPEGAQELECSFVRYAAFTDAEGVRAELAYLGEGAEADFENTDVRGKIVVVDIVESGVVPKMGDTYFRYDPDNTIALDEERPKWPLKNFHSSYRMAHERGAAGWIGVLKVFNDDTHQYLHAYVQYEIPALTVSANTGEALRALARNGGEATLVLTGTRGQGEGYNVYGYVQGQRSDEFVVSKTHYDGWATNEASGAAVTMAVAQRLAALPSGALERTHMFFFRANHFGVGWSMHADERGLTPEQAQQIYGMSPGWDDFSTRVWEAMPRTAAANNIEMIGRQYHYEDGAWRPTGLPAIRYWGVTGPEGGANPILLEAVRNAIRSNNLTRSQVSNFFVGDGSLYPRQGVPFVNFISHNVYQFTNKDTPETVMREDLENAAKAMTDIALAEDRADFDALRPAVDVAFSHG